MPELLHATRRLGRMELKLEREQRPRAWRSAREESTAERWDDAPALAQLFRILENEWDEQTFPTRGPRDETKELTEELRPVYNL